MASIASQIPHQWIPEDDLLLKNAIEGGASLEALAKGAVRFSRKFSLSELRERWYSLLYNPVISKEASAKMIELQFSGSNSSCKVTDIVEDSLKRKLDSVRRLYNIMRKKTRSSQNGCFVDQFDARLKDSASFVDCGGTHFECEKNIGNVDPVDVRNGSANDQRCGLLPESRSKDSASFVNCDQTHYEHDKNVGNVDLDNVRNDSVDDQKCGLLPESSDFGCTERVSSLLVCWDMVEDVSLSAMPLRVIVDDEGPKEALMYRNDGELDENQASVSGRHVLSDTMLRDGRAFDEVNNSYAISDSDYADISELLLVDADGEEAINTSCNDVVLVNREDFHDDSLDIKGLQTVMSNTNSEIPASTCTMEAKSADIEQHGNCDVEIKLLPSTSAMDVEKYDEELDCTLNSEDTEIPCNDGALLGIKFKVVRTLKETDSLSLACTNLKDDKHEQNLMEEEDHPAESIINSQLRELNILPTAIQGNNSIGWMVKHQSPEDCAVRLTSNVDMDPNQCNTTAASLTSAKVGILKALPLQACNAINLHLYAQSRSRKQTTSPVEVGPSVLNDEDSDDDDVPSYAEIEAMILQLDLVPDDTDYYCYRKVSRYENEDSRRTIVRLEQSAQSSIQRTIASRGALAVLYGRHLRHYIKETEVIIGRSTDEMEVDIDLRREGPASKISRRQALLKLETDGSFLLKNLGKSPVYLNGKEVVTGQSTGLRSTSLIEIGEMAFMFEINSKSIARHVKSAAENRKNKEVRFEWSERVA